MKRFAGSILAVVFLAGSAAPLFAADTSKEATPTAKTMKHKTVKPHKKAGHSKKSAVKPAATPATKK